MQKANPMLYIVNILCFCELYMYIFYCLPSPPSPPSPLHLPLSALLGVSSVQLSTSLVAGSPLVVVRILVDHTHLAFAADTHQQHLPTLKNGQSVMTCIAC